MKPSTWKRSACAVLTTGLALTITQSVLLGPLGVDYTHGGWRASVAWLIIFLALSRFFQRVIELFLPLAKPRSRPDLYTLAEAEMAAESKVAPVRVTAPAP